MREAAVAVFEARAAEAAKLGRPTRTWPPTIAAYAHWKDDYIRAAASGGIGLSLEDAVGEVSAWIEKLDSGQ